ncbi:ETX/MTX2 family pore-forming toxin [Spiroplasma endosymbiont of Tricholauxania praeusta]|uniref:ETX/MTX2 family pore-forming toxin n=1 Tax=Spiroplasma endosymbiont of Tricholauxania praeusta TaxID=3066296 RepID=UPI0030D58DE8
MGHMKNKGYWLENMKLNIKNNEILSNDKISLINLTKTFETSERTELKNNTNLEQQLSTQEYDKEVTNTYSVTNTYDVGISEKISIPFEETTFNFNFGHSTTNTNSESVTLKYPGMATLFRTVFW